MMCKCLIVIGGIKKWYRPDLSENRALLLSYIRWSNRSGSKSIPRTSESSIKKVDSTRLVRGRIGASSQPLRTTGVDSPATILEKSQEQAPNLAVPPTSKLSLGEYRGGGGG